MTVYPSKKTEIGICPGCNTRIRFKNKVELGEFVICDECGDELEVVQMEPISLDWAYAVPYEDDSWDLKYSDGMDD